MHGSTGRSLWPKLQWF